MFRAFQVVLQPTAGQTIALQRLLDAQRELYNAALEERIGAWRWEHRTVSRFEQFGSLTGWDHPVLGFGVCPARGTLTRLDRAFQAFHRRCRDGDTPGFPRFKSKSRWDSVEYPDTSCWQITHTSGAVGRVTLKGVGGVRWRGSRRAIRGTPKTLTVRRCGRRWILTVFCADVEPVALEPSEDVVGVDVGVSELVATSDGDLVGNPRHLRCTFDRLAGAQRLVAAEDAAPCGAVRLWSGWGGCIARSSTSAATTPIKPPGGSSTGTARSCMRT